MEDTQDRTRERYHRGSKEIRLAFETTGSGSETVKARAGLLDGLVRSLWAAELEAEPKLATGVALVAVGGYGREQLFPCSDLDLMFLGDKSTPEKEMKDAIRRVSQQLWDCSVRVSPLVRRISDCESFDPENVEFTLSLLDHRFLAGDAKLHETLAQKTLPKLLASKSKDIVTRLVEITHTRHAKYGDTLFHLEPNIKDCPGGLRDVHVCRWLERLRSAGSERAMAAPESSTFVDATEFLTSVRCFLHYRHERDDNTLDWQAQEGASAMGIGLKGRGTADTAYWMRIYFRHARSVERRATQMLEDPDVAPAARSRLHRAFRIWQEAPSEGFRIERGRVLIDAATDGDDPVRDPDTVLLVFAAVARTGCKLGAGAEERISEALPVLSTQIQEGRALWNRLQPILLGRYAGEALRAMHALGLLELLLPEFHGIDALATRDAWHRYTVDEHTFVVIDTLHGLEVAQDGKMADWAAKFGAMLKEVHHPELLYLAALLHDTGKGCAGEHARQSARLAAGVVGRLELDEFESGLVLPLIQNHLEMSLALRRDIFDTETIRAFAAKVQTGEALRLLTLFTYADINAVNPDALTPFKAENLWRLGIATLNYLDRSVDEERVTSREEGELIDRVMALLPGKKEQVHGFLEGFPERYLRTRTAEHIKRHFEMAAAFAREAVQTDFRYNPDFSRLTVVTPDRGLLFATISGVLAAWGMNIVSADAFANSHGTVVDSFRFTDTFRTLELNESERERFVDSVREALSTPASLEKMLRGRRRGPRQRLVTVETRIGFDGESSSHSTLLEVIAQDVPGLLRAISLALAEQGCNIEVALIDTEGEMAIDVFYLTKDGGKLSAETEATLRRSLLEALEGNAS